MPENDSTKNKKYDQIRALMTKARHPNTPPEEANASREKALALAAKYSLEEALAAAGGNALREKPEMKDFFIYDDEAGVPSGAGMSAQARLLIRIARSLHCAMVDWGDRSGWIVTVCGCPSDLAAVSLLWESLRLQAISAAVNAEIPPGRSARHFRAGVMKGFAEQVAERLRQPEEQGEPGAAVALRSRESEAWDFLREYLDSLPPADAGSEQWRQAGQGLAPPMGSRQDGPRASPPPSGSGPGQKALQ